MQKRVVEPQADETRTESKVARAEPSRGAPDAAHTPGPWRTGREDMQSYDGATGEPFASVYCDDERAGMHLGERLPYLIATTFGDECKANARLIAQAPTLLAENEKLRAGHVVLLEALRRLRTTLQTHWLSQIECNHYEQNDSAICACGWKSDRGFNVGKAVEFWIDHVWAEIDEIKAHPWAGQAERGQ